MSQRVAYIFQGDPSDGVSDEPLKHLDNNVKKIKEILEDKGDWVVTPFELIDAKGLKQALKQVSEDTTTEEFLFYYTGHGKAIGDSYYLIGSEEKYINLPDVFHLNEFYTQAVSLVIDACESHILINKWENERPYEILVATKSGSAYEGNLSNMSDFSHCFYHYLKDRSLDVGTGIRLEDIKCSLPKQECDHIAVKNRPRSIIVHQEGLASKKYLESLKNSLKDVVPDEDQLRLYVNNLLSQDFDNVDVFKMDYDGIIDHLYDLRRPLLCLLHNLNSNLLAEDLRELKEEFPEVALDDCISKDEMKYETSNLLITFEPQNGDVSSTMVRIWRYQEPYAVEIGHLLVDLKREKNQKKLVDTIVSSITVSRQDVLIEFIMPFELISIDIRSWSTSDGQNLIGSYNIVRRLLERIEKTRGNTGALKDWSKYWGHYRNRSREILKDIVLVIDETNQDDIDFFEFEERPYLRLEQPIDSLELYKKFIDESAGIIMVPVDDKTEFKKVCLKMQERTLDELVEESFRKFRKNKHASYILIWDNPNRLIKTNPQVTGE